MRLGKVADPEAILADVGDFPTVGGHLDQRFAYRR
jgi:hypothetical protein